MLAEKKLNIKNYQDTLLLNKNIDSMIKNFKLWDNDQSWIFN